MLNLVDSDAANANRAFFADNRERSLEILTVREHGNVDGAERTGPPSNVSDASVLDFDVAIERCCKGVYALNRSDEPIEQVDVMTRLVHESAAVELPCAAPRRTVVVRLW